MDDYIHDVEEIIDYVNKGKDGDPIYYNDKITFKLKQLEFYYERLKYIDNKNFINLIKLTIEKIKIYIDNYNSIKIENKDQSYSKYSNSTTSNIDSLNNRRNFILGFSAWDDDFKNITDSHIDKNNYNTEDSNELENNNDLEMNNILKINDETNKHKPLWFSMFN